MVQEYSNAAGTAQDISKIIDTGLRCIKRYWFQLLLLIGIVVCGMVFYSNTKYDPTYTAQVTYAVSKTDYTTVDSDIAKRLSTSLSQLNEMHEFKNELLEGIKPGTKNMDFSISSQFTEDITLFTVSITAKRYENANILLDRFMKVYPVWASKSIGAVELQVVGTNYTSSGSVSSYSIFSIIVKGLGLALVMCIGIMYLYTMFVKTVVKESDMRSIGVRNCIANVPNVKEKKRTVITRDHLLITNPRVDWGYKQSILAAHSRIDNQMTAEENKVILVTSTVPQEGKSSITVNLALAFAEKGNKVLLIDGDFRKPAVSKVFGVEEKEGLTDCFVDLIHPSKLIQKMHGVDYISAGTYEGAVSGILDSKIMDVIMRRWRSYYDYILIDSAPSMYTDSSILSQYADNVLYIVRYDTCDVKEIKEYISKYVANGKLIGYIINRNPGGFMTYGRYGRYGRYGKHGRYNSYIERDMENSYASAVEENQGGSKKNSGKLKPEKKDITSMNTEDIL